MVTKRKVGLTAFAFCTVALSSGLFLYMAPASTSVDPAPVAVRPWSSYLSENAVDSAGIERDLDGNAASLR